MILAQRAIEQSSQSVVPRVAFESLLKECHFHESELTSVVEKLSAAGLIVPVENGEYFHLRPSQLVADWNEVQLETLSQSGDSLSLLSMVRDAEQQLTAAQQDFSRRLEALQPAAARTAAWRKRVWSGALLFAGTQLAVISRLTYFDLDWDIMEPVSYFLGTGTSLVFFLYVLRFRREHSYSDFDATFLPGKLRQYAPKDYDWTGLEASKERVEAARRELTRVKTWAKYH